jgi:hypothetical protein
MRDLDRSEFLAGHATAGRSPKKKQPGPSPWFGLRYPSPRTMTGFWRRGGGAGSCKELLAGRASECSWLLLRCYQPTATCANLRRSD